MISATRLCGRSLVKVSGRLRFGSPPGTISRKASSTNLKKVPSKKTPTNSINSIKVVDQSATVGIIDPPERSVRHFKCPHCSFTDENKNGVKEVIS